MNQEQAGRILKSMIAFIEQHGSEEVQSINDSADNEFTIQKNNFVAEEKIKIHDNYKNLLANEEVKMKIEKSKQQNSARIERMRKVNEIVEDLKKELRNKMRKDMKADAAAYKGLMKNLLIQVRTFTSIFIFYLRVSSNSWKVKFSLDAEKLTKLSLNP